MKKILSFMLLFTVVICCAVPSRAAVVDAVMTVAETDLKTSAKSALLMEASTGRVLFAENETEPLAPASVTKMMTLLLIMEALDAGSITLNQTVTVSEYAASMGGTQLYLEVGEQMTVNDLIKAITIPSANDATVAMAELIAGTEQAFVEKMNEKAEQLTLKNTHFTCSTGLFDDEEHYSCAYDLAVICRELMHYDKIFEYSTVWMDTLRNGTFGLSNTDKMLKTYQGMNGMKTGYTRLAGFCFCGTAERNGMTMIAVVMGEPTSDIRFRDTASLLDYGFAGYEIIKKVPTVSGTLPALKAKKSEYALSVSGEVSLLVKKGQGKDIREETDLPQTLETGLKKGDVVGHLVYKSGNTVLAAFDITVAEDVKRAGVFDYLSQILQKIF